MPRRADFELDRRFGLIVAPMQLIQLLPDRDARLRCLGSAAAHLSAGGVVALAIVEVGETEVPSSPLLPDVREVDGWVYSSQPLGAVRDADGLTVDGCARSSTPPATWRRAATASACSFSPPPSSRTRVGRLASAPPAVKPSSQPTPTSARPSCCWRR